MIVEPTINARLQWVRRRTLPDQRLALVIPLPSPGEDWQILDFDGTVPAPQQVIWTLQRTPHGAHVLTRRDWTPRHAWEARHLDSVWTEACRKQGKYTEWIEDNGTPRPCPVPLISQHLCDPVRAYLRAWTRVLEILEENPDLWRQRRCH